MLCLIWKITPENITTVYQTAYLLFLLPVCVVMHQHIVLEDIWDQPLWVGRFGGVLEEVLLLAQLGKLIHRVRVGGGDDQHAW